MFFFNLETAALNELLKTAHETDWASLASGVLRQYDRNMADGQIAEAIHCEQGLADPPRH